MVGATTGSFEGADRRFGAEWVDLAAAIGLTACGLVGFRTVYGGIEWSIAAFVGITIGVVLARIGARLRLDALVLAAATVLAYFVLSGFGDPDEAVVRVVPTWGTITAAGHTAVFGWADLLGVTPPIGRAYGLLGIPLLCALVGTVLSASWALRTRSIVLPLLPPAVVLVVSIVFGTHEPAAVVVQGGLFFAGTLGWVTWRRRAMTQRTVRTGGRVREGAGLAIIAIAVIVGGVGNQMLPGVEKDHRYVLRDHVTPPFDPWVFPSPLVEFRSFAQQSVRPGCGDLFEAVSGMTASVPLRIAVLDYYDGVSWRVASAARRPDSVSGVFERVGTHVDAGTGSTTRTIRYTVACGAASRQQVWIPSVGTVRAIRFFGPRAAALRAGLRLNRVTNTALSTAYLQLGDRVEVDVSDGPPPVGEPGLERAHPAEVASGPLVLDAYAGQYQQIAKMASILAPKQTTAMAKFIAVAEALRSNSGLVPPRFGYGDEDPAMPGHGIVRLADMACAVDPKCSGTPAYGNDEQYAALLALVGRSLDLPTRVVVGVCTTPQRPAKQRDGSASVCDGGARSGTSTIPARNVTAWVEVATKEYGWQPVVATNRTNDTPQNQQQQPAGTDKAGQVPPGAAAVGNSQQANRAGGSERPTSKPADGTDIPWALIGAIALPVLLIGSIVLGVVVAKRRRARRRRTTGDPRLQCLGAWQEITDLALDLGTPVPLVATRREAARILGRPAVAAAADATDAAVFGRAEPTAVEVEQHWMLAERARHELLQHRTAWQRTQAGINPASLLRPVTVRRAARGRAALLRTTPSRPEGSR